MVNESDRAAGVTLTFQCRATIEQVTGDLTLTAGSLAELKRALRAFPQAGIETAPAVAVRPLEGHRTCRCVSSMGP